MTTARVLIVDDDEDILKVLSAHFKARDEYEVLTVPDPQKALEIVGSTPVDLLISDIMMSGMLGPKLFQEVRRTSPETVCILISGYNKEMYNLPSDALFLEKPFDAGKLFSTIEKALDRSA